VKSLWAVCDQPVTLAAFEEEVRTIWPTAVIGGRLALLGCELWRG
jgi:hypothetical protein